MKNKYSFFEQILHKMTVANPMFNDISFGIEKNLFLPHAAAAEPNIIFITGLARSGTTSILNHLTHAAVGHSLTYNDLPFLFIPNASSWFWKKKKTSALVERAHGDSILINQDSPEAIDEIFWKYQLENEYIDAMYLKSHRVKTEDVHQYKHFIRLHLSKAGKSVYLTKNNNTILRIKSLLENTSLKASYIFAIRDPLSHAISLLKQHRLFTIMHKEDSFSLSYFNSMGHHEFGMNQKAFCFNDEGVNQSFDNLDKFQLDYWLHTWLNYHRFLLSLLNEKLIFVSFDDLCANPTEIMAQVVSTCQVKAAIQPIRPYKAPNYHDLNEPYSNELLADCQEVYHILKSRCLSTK